MASANAKLQSLKEREHKIELIFTYFIQNAFPMEAQKNKTQADISSLSAWKKQKSKL